MNALRWITNEAKKIRREHPRRFEKWTDYVAQASAIYARKHKGKSPVGKKKNAGKKRTVGRTKKRIGKKVSHRRKIGAASRREVGKDRTDNKKVNITVGSISTAQARSVVVNNTKEQLAWALLQRDTAKNKTARRKINKKVSSLRRQLHNYQ